jgi:hypothetical protein
MRLSSGRRGTYLTFSGGGFTYRKKLDEVTPARNSYPVALDPSEPGLGPAMEVSRFVDSSAGELVQEIRERRSRVPWTVVYVVAVAVGLYQFSSALPDWGVITLAACLLVPIKPIYDWDKDRRTTRVFYDSEDVRVQQRLSLIAAIGSALSSASTVWMVDTSRRVYDWKRNAGAARTVERKVVSMAGASALCIESNVPMPTLKCSLGELVLMPDRVIASARGRYSSVRWCDLRVAPSQTTFIEDGYVPSDARQVGSTWQFVRKDGGPDRRFSNNRQLPVLLYGVLGFEADSGLRVILYASTAVATESAAAALWKLAAEDRRAA